MSDVAQLFGHDQAHGVEEQERLRSLNPRKSEAFCKGIKASANRSINHIT
jgi:hypothetical protein